MAENLVITIGRSTGSGGRVIGQKVAEMLGVKCFDKELLSRASEDSGISEDLLKKHDEKPSSSFLYSLVMDSYSLGFNSIGSSNLPINHKIFLAQFDSIKRLAKEQSCVIVGRCADYALAENPNVVRVFISAEDEDRIARLCERHNLTPDKAKDLMVKSDKQRSSYYNYYSSKRWGDIKNYDLCLNSSVLGIDATAEIILEFAKRKISKNKE